MLVGHDASFGTARNRPNYLREIDLPIGGTWRARLQALTDDVIEERFADSLDRRRRKRRLPPAGIGCSRSSRTHVALRARGR